MISLNVFWDAEEEMIGERLGVWCAYFLLLDAIVYLNHYVLFPRLLLRNKMLLYILSVAVLIPVAIFCIGLLQGISAPAGEVSGGVNISEILMGITASVLTLGLFIAGISTLLFFRYRMEQSRRIEELKSASLQSELKYLKSQINPHFLFNMLNSANIMVHENAVASHILIKLNDLLRYQINGSAGDSFVSLSNCVVTAHIGPVTADRSFESVDIDAITFIFGMIFFDSDRVIFSGSDRTTFSLFSLKLFTIFSGSVVIFSSFFIAASACIVLLHS
jgi:hypothetical protein